MCVCDSSLWQSDCAGFYADSGLSVTAIFRRRREEQPGRLGGTPFWRLLVTGHHRSSSSLSITQSIEAQFYRATCGD